MPPRHAQKIASRLKFLVSHVVQQELNDPRLGFITILDVEMTSDLREAKIYFSVLGPRAEQSKSLQAIESSCGFIQRQVGKNLKLRNIPVLRFVLDDTDDRVSRIEEILAKDREPEEEPDPEEASGEETD
ncbi:MAG: 30S ribosome-binding factor RbfA [Planctomycetota bacterium]|nr:30S ribosome-binding factor RbfA [Planctomycetota bacterium]